MKLTLASSAILLLTNYASGQCIQGSFSVHFEGRCNKATILAAFTEQVFNNPVYSCAGTAEAELNAQLQGKTYEQLCTDILSQSVSLSEVVGTEGPDFVSNYYQGRTYWNDERQTESEDDTKVLREQAHTIPSYFEVSKKTDFLWPGDLPQFDLSKCEARAAMCCWVQDRQANDGNGNCASPYDTQCIDKDPGDNTDLCYVDLGRYDGHAKSNGFVTFNGDNNNGEGPIHCHGQAWASTDDHFLSRYKGNNLFYVSMYDHMYKRGYVREVPGAPMCGCVEHMPIVSRSDCTQTNVQETFELTKVDGQLVVELKTLNLAYQACQGINAAGAAQNNDLEAYVRRLVQDGTLTANHQAKLAETIKGSCNGQVNSVLEAKGYTKGYENDASMWLPVVGLGSLLVSNPINDPIQFKNLFAKRPNQIIRRVCTSCFPSSHQDIYYKRKTPVPAALDLLDLVKNNWFSTNNQFHVDFDLYSSYQDAMTDTNPWQFCNFDDPRVGFPRDCGPTVRVNSNWNSFILTPPRAKDVAFFIEAEEGPVGGGDSEGGGAVADPTPDLENLAKGKTCYQVSTAYEAKCDRAIDGSWSGNFNELSTTHTHSHNKPWWMVDLGNTHEIARIVIANRQDCCWNRLTNVHVEIMETMAGPTLKEFFFEGVQGRMTTIEVENVKGRWVKVWTDHGTNKAPLSLAEVGVYGKALETPPPILANVAKGKQCWQSTHYNDNSKCERAFDGDIWSIQHTQRQNRPWIMVDLGANYDLSNVLIANRSDCCMGRTKNVKVEVMETIAGPVVETKSLPGVAPRFSGVYFETPVTGRFVRLTIEHDTGVSEYMNLAEVMVHGVESATQPEKLTNVAPESIIVAQSSTAHGGFASRAVDGNTNPYWTGNSVTHTNSQFQPWWSAYFGPTTVNHVILYNRFEYSNILRDVKVDLFSDLEATQLVATQTLAGPVGPVGGAYFDSVEAKSVKVSCDFGTSRRALMLAEVEVIGTKEAGGNFHNIALNKSASQSSVGYAGVAERAIDGNTSPNWNSASMTHTLKEVDPWWQVDLLKSYEIHDVVLFNRYDCCFERMTDAKIELLETAGGTLIEELTIAGTVPRGGYASVNFGGKRGGAIRVSLSGETVLNLAEVIVIADPATQGPLAGEPVSVAPSAGPSSKPVAAPSSSPSLAPTGAPTVTGNPPPPPPVTASPTSSPSSSPTLGTQCQGTNCSCTGLNCGVDAEGKYTCGSYDCQCETYDCTGSGGETAPAPGDGETVPAP